MESEKSNDEECLAKNEVSDIPLTQMDLMVSNVIQNALEGLRISRENELFLQNSLKTLVRQENIGVNQKWLELKGKFSRTLNQNQHLLKLIRLVVKEARKKEEILKEQFLREVEDLKTKLQSVRIEFEAKEAKLYHELGIARSSAAVQNDEKESNLKRQLVDANSKARNQQNEIRCLHLEIQNLRTRLSNNQGSSDLRNNVLIFNPMMNPLDTLYEERPHEQSTPRLEMDLNRSDGGIKWRDQTGSTGLLEKDQDETTKGDGSNLKTGGTGGTDDLGQDQDHVLFRKSPPKKFPPLNISVQPKGPKVKTPGAPRKRSKDVPPLLAYTATPTNAVREAPVKRRRVKLFNPNDYID